ncbi:MAG: ATP-dependent Lon protease, partial [Microgenomates group bacterium Gr01-1014_80]
RLEPIQMPAYSDEEKMTIGKNYLLPKAIAGAGLQPGQIIVDEGVWPAIIRPLGFDAGIRSLNRTLEGLARKIARAVVEGKPGPFKITAENVGEYISS